MLQIDPCSLTIQLTAEQCAALAEACLCAYDQAISQADKRLIYLTLSQLFQAATLAQTSFQELSPQQQREFSTQPISAQGVGKADKTEAEE